MELVAYEDARNKIASLRDEKAGTVSKDGISTIEEILNQTADA